VKPPTISADNHVRSTADNHVRNTALFFSFFPHLAAGPIVRPQQFYPQIGVKRFGDIDWKGSIENLITGYFFKTVIADNLASQTSPFLSHFASLSGKDVIAGWLGFSARIFSDFAGYSLIAIGLAAMFGYKLPTNFNFPYRSQSLSEFWTRWHISLSTWIRDYLYIPLGGNRKGTLRTYLNLMLVMLLGGLWHGGKVGLAVWGLYHGAGLCIERALGLSHNSSKSSAVIAFRVLTVFLFFAAGLILFELPLHMVRECLVSIVTHWKFASDAQHTFLVCLFVLPVFIWHAVDLWAQKHPEVSARKRLLKELVLATMLFMVITDSGDSREFFYFQF
jgi:alginate O-acetyltransferase complex protein AlgI